MEAINNQIKNIWKKSKSKCDNRLQAQKEMAEFPELVFENIMR